MTRFPEGELNIKLTTIDFAGVSPVHQAVLRICIRINSKKKIDFIQNKNSKQNLKSIQKNIQKADSSIINCELNIKLTTIDFAGVSPVHQAVLRICIRINSKKKIDFIQNKNSKQNLKSIQKNIQKADSSINNES